MASTPAGSPAALHPTADPAWLASGAEEILEPGLPIVDAHHHLWGPPRGPYLGAELAADIGEGHRVVATVFADCTEGYRTDGPEGLRSVGETEFAAQVAREAEAGAYGGVLLCAGIFSRVEMRDGAAVAEALHAHIEAGQGRFKGVRFSSPWDADPAIRSTARLYTEGLLYDPTVREGIACLAPLGLTLDTWLYHPQIQDVADLAEAFPDTQIILDHVGGPVGTGRYAGKRDEAYAVWRKGVEAVARQPNVSVKLGGLAMELSGFDFHEGPKPPSSQELADAWRPYVEPCIELFGADRAMFESNFPVDKFSCSYGLLWNAFKRLAAGASAQEKTALFSGTAARVYSLDLSAATA
ncbi:MAG: amidohydrolase family protein [Phenylobacterium sp.]|uniref:amidohydrolase family protein n=1 Tax=Phenylobacterium sp. TaxID=1871053 RepID=UPI00273537C4|nr:amidohydrolase family protein [Phenylobacterium sp.]MDP3172843.1 amidohydrolase family protein [Phenylobacterium sp.]